MTTILTLLVPIALWLIDQFLLNKKQDQESRDLLIRLAQHLRNMGVKRAKSRFESGESQYESGIAEWEKREKEENDKATPKSLERLR